MVTPPTRSLMINHFQFSINHYSARAELAVAGITETGPDEAAGEAIIFVGQAFVNRGNVDVQHQGWVVWSASIPSGAAIRPTNLIRATPQRFKTSTAAMAEPPVANIGSKIRQSCTVGSVGSLL